MKSLQALLAPLVRQTGSTTGPIGIDLAQDRLNLAQFDGTPSGPSVRAAASLAYPCGRDELLASPPRLKALLRQALRPYGFKGSRVVSCLRPDEMRILLVNYPAAENDAQAITAELRQRLKGELATSVIDFMPIRNDDGDPNRRDALVVVAPRVNVIRHLELLDSVGLEASSLDVGPAALARLISFVNALDVREKHPNVLLINFGHVTSHVSVVWGRRLILDRAIEFGERSLLDRLARVLGIAEDLATRMLEDTGFAEEAAAGDEGELARTMAEVLRPEFAALVGEINKTLVYTASRSRGRSIDRIYLLGSVGRYSGVDRVMQQLLELPVEVLDPFRAFRSTLRETDQARLRPIAGLALACGLSLRGMRDG